jgi:hypothetical protein
MKLPIFLTVLILAVGSIWGVRETRNINRLREQHRLVVEEASALGLPVDLSKPQVRTKAANRQREEVGRKGREFAALLVDFAKTLKEMQTSGQPPDEATQKRIIEMMDGLLALNSGELKELIAELNGRQDLDDEMKKGMVSFSIIMLAQQNPEAALAFFTESSDLLGDHPMSKHALTAALSQWAKDQPLAALEWIQKNAGKHPDLVNEQTKAAVIAGTADHNIALALQLIGELKLSIDKSEVMNHIAQTATTPERRAELLDALRKQAENTTDKVEGEKLLSKGLQSLFHQVAGTGYDATMAWLESAALTETETANIASANLNYHQTKAETGKWLDWLSSQPMEREKSDNTTRNLVRNWTENDYKAAGEWLAQAPAGRLKETATISYLETIAPYESEVAAQWADTLPAEKQKDAMNRIYQKLKNMDHAAAEEFATKHGLEIHK